MDTGYEHRVMRAVLWSGASVPLAGTRTKPTRRPDADEAEFLESALEHERAELRADVTRGVGLRAIAWAAALSLPVWASIVALLLWLT